MSQGRVLAVDYGGKRTGLASSDPMRIIASPIDPIIERDLEKTAQAVADSAIEREALVVVVGMPFLPNGNEGEQCAKVRLFIQSLQLKLPAGVKIVEIDERFSTHEAERLLRQSGKRRKDFKGQIDSTAAMVLLREFLEL